MTKVLFKGQSTLSSNHLDVLPVLSDSHLLLLHGHLFLFIDKLGVLLECVLLLLDLVVLHLCFCSLTILDVLQVLSEKLTFVIPTWLFFIEDSLAGPKANTLLRDKLLKRFRSNEFVALQIFDNLQLVLVLLL